MREGISFDSVAFSSLPEVIRDIGKRHLATKSKREYDCYKDCFSILDMFKSCYPQTEKQSWRVSGRAVFMSGFRITGLEPWASPVIR